jgi:hypothetical protein
MAQYESDRQTIINEIKKLMVYVNAPTPPSISPTAQSFSNDGGSGSIRVSADASYTWSVVNNNSWITISPLATTQGNGTVNYSVAANTTRTPRYGAITVAGLQFIVSQAATTTTNNRRSNLVKKR